MPYVNINGIRTHYQQTGQGPDVVLIHAFTSNLAVWVFINLIDTLAADFRVTAYDLRGHGNTEKTPDGFTSDVLAADFHELHRALGLGPAYCVGHSLGGVVATHAAVLHPEDVAGVIISDPYFPGLRHIDPDMGHAPMWRELRLTLQRVGAEIGEEVDFQRLFHEVRGMNEEQFEQVRRLLGPNGARWLTQLTHLGETTAARDIFEPAGLTEDKLKSIQQPLVALYDEHSPFLATCDFLERELPNCTKDIVPGAEHMALFQNPAAFVGMVLKYLCEMAGVQNPKYKYSRCPDCGQANLLKAGWHVCNVCGRDLSAEVAR